MLTKGRNERDYRPCGRGLNVMIRGSRSGDASETVCCRGPWGHPVAVSSNDVMRSVFGIPEYKNVPRQGCRYVYI